MKSKKPLVLYILTSLYALLYIMFIFSDGVQVENLTAEFIATGLLFLFFAAAYTLSWFNPGIAGYLFISWYVFMMALAINVWTDAGMAIIMGFPVHPIGVFYVLYAFKKSEDPPPDSRRQWKKGLQTSMIGLIAVFLAGIIRDLLRFDVFSFPYIFLPLLALILLAAFAFSWRYERIAGILLILWYAVILVISAIYPDLPNEVGPMRLMGSPFLVLGILYVLNREGFKREKILSPE